MYGLKYPSEKRVFPQPVKPLGPRWATKPSLRNQVGQELGMADDSGKHWQVLLEREPLFFRREGRCTVSEGYHFEALLVAGTSRRFHAAIGQESGDGQCLDPA